MRSQIFWITIFLVQIFFTNFNHKKIVVVSPRFLKNDIDFINIHTHNSGCYNQKSPHSNQIPIVVAARVVCVLIKLISFLKNRGVFKSLKNRGETTTIFFVGKTKNCNPIFRPDRNFLTFYRLRQFL